MPGTFYGPHSARHLTFAAPSGNANLGTRPLGHTLIVPDGREYKYALNDGTVEVAGNLYQSVAPVTNHTNVAADVARAVGATTISATLGATQAAIDIYAEGTVHINDVDGEGHTYRIRRAMSSGAAHALAAASAVLTVSLEYDESVQIALTTNSEMSFTRNRYHQILIHPSPPTAGLAGVSPGVAAANRFYWSQTKGYAAVLASGTLLAGLPVMAGVTTDGSVESYKRRLQINSTGSVLTAGTNLRAAIVDQDGSDTGVFAVVSASVTQTYDITGGIANNAPIVGICVKANATTEYALIDLDIR